VTVSSWLNFGRPAPPGRGSAAERKILAPPYYSQRAVFASLWAFFSISAYYSGYFSQSLVLPLCIDITWVWTYRNDLTDAVAWIGVGGNVIDVLREWLPSQLSVSVALGSFRFNKCYVICYVISRRMELGTMLRELERLLNYQVYSSDFVCALYTSVLCTVITIYCNRIQRLSVKIAFLCLVRSMCE